MSESEQIETFIKSNNSSQLIVKGSILKGAIYNDSSKPKTKWDTIIDFQSEWKSKLRSNIVVYFNELPTKVSLGTKKLYNKNKLIFKKKFQSYNASISPIFNQRVNLVIVDSYQNLQFSILPYKERIKIWDFNKTTQFFNRMDIKVPQLIDLEKDQVQTQYEDIQYFNNDPYVYLFDKLQSYRPIVCRHWDQSKLNSMSYPTLYINSYGRCPFQKEDDKDNGDRSSRSNIIKKRYFRDELNKRYALKLKGLYRFHANISKNLEDPKNQYVPIDISHDCLDSRKLFDEINKIKLKRTNTNFKFMSFNEFDTREKMYNEFNGIPDNDLIDLQEDHTNLSSQDTLETELGSDAKLSSLGDFEARTDLRKDIYATGFNSTHKSIGDFYCENCKTKFTSLKEHSKSENHLSFAYNDSNFSEIDEFIKQIHERK